jgi:serine/threonine protein kinase
MGNKRSLKNKTLKNKTLKKKGGDPYFLGSGTYGCVYKPPIKCEGECTDPRCHHNSKVVSKYMNNKYATVEKEMFDQLHLNNINHRNQYHIGKPYKCKPSSDFKPNPYECDVKIETPSLLLYEDGGKDLDDFLKKPCLPYDFVNKMENLLEFILKMINFKVVHCDIKNGNIVSGIDGNKFRFIDFGLAIHFKNDRFQYDSIFRKVYYFWLPSAIFLSNTPEEITDEMIEKYCIEFHKKTQYHKFLNTYIIKHNFNIYNLKQILIDLREQIKKGASISTILKHIDLYSFTAVLDYYLYHHINKFFPEFSMKIALLFAKFIEDTEIYNPNVFKSCLPEDFYKYFKQFKEDIKNLGITSNNIKRFNSKSFNQLKRKTTYKKFGNSI